MAIGVTGLVGPAEDIGRWSEGMGPLCADLAIHNRPAEAALLATAITAGHVPVVGAPPVCRSLAASNISWSDWMHGCKCPGPVKKGLVQ